MSDLILVLRGFVVWGAIPAAVVLAVISALILWDRRRSRAVVSIPITSAKPTGPVYLIVGRQRRERCDYRLICDPARGEERCRLCTLFDDTISAGEGVEL